ncbi:MAG: type II secretion system F family protein [Chloroflexi bacterium]|nr:type II secretion system F family protein [Chloroflexota bacterium]
MLVPLVSITIFLAVALTAIAMLTPREGATVGTRLQAYTFGQAWDETPELSRPFFDRAIRPLFGVLERVVWRLTPQGMAERAKKDLIMAGNPYGLGVGGFLAFRAMFLLGLPVLYLLVIASNGAGLGAKQLLALVAIVVIGAVLPDYWLKSRVGARQTQIQKSLPDALDLITICVESGLALEGALGRVTEKSKGPLADGFKEALQDISLGKSRREALRDLGKRTGVPDLISFIAAIVQADQTGVSVANVLRVQSDAMRIRRRQRAQEKAAAAPVKMLFPLIMFIMPSVWVVILGPAAIRVMENLFSKI